MLRYALWCLCLWQPIELIGTVKWCRGHKSSIIRWFTVFPVRVICAEAVVLTYAVWGHELAVLLFWREDNSCTISHLLTVEEARSFRYSGVTRWTAAHVGEGFKLVNIIWSKAVTWELGIFYPSNGRCAYFTIAGVTLKLQQAYVGRKHTAWRQRPA